jgi:hypothetical protein
MVWWLLDWVDLFSLSRGPKARICTISHMRTRMLYLTWDASPWSWCISWYSHHLHTRHQTVLRLTIQVHMQQLVLRYGSWGEPCACILWYREEKRRKTRDIYRRHQPLQPWPCIRPVTSCTFVTTWQLHLLSDMRWSTPEAMSLHWFAGFKQMVKSSHIW